MTTRQQLEDFYRTLLSPDSYSDYGPNGLQIEGNTQLKTVAFAVSATRHSIAEAIDKNADTLVVHHGLFWKFHGARPLTGPFAKRIVPLINHNINLLAYHLPLDGHAEIGNAATLGNLIGCVEQQAFGDYRGSPTGIKGRLSSPCSASSLQLQLEQILNHKVIIASANENRIINTVGIITGGANSEWHLAQKEGLDAYITGEISEHDWHESQEAGIHMFAGGHNATEQFGIQALMEKTRQQFGLECFFISSKNPA